MSRTVPKDHARGSGTLPDDATVNIGGSGSVPAASSTSAQFGALVGRYVVLAELGRGAMGRVLRAYDPKLQREVALKEVHDRGLGKEGMMRLMAEARAMAQLSHANVVGVFDVEERPDGSVVLVMEYIEGIDLRAWLDAEERAWPEVVERFREAGRGLAAAHAAGLLHRDFKPANVMVGNGGEVKVGDFGLAKADGSAASMSVKSWDRAPASDLTHAGTVMGTPRYMAPEQHVGAELAPAADQYSFCVALWEGLCGAPPFAGVEGYEQLAAAKRDGPPPWPNGRVPRPIVEVIVRGLNPDPTKRWPSMDTLLDALAWDEGKRRRRVFVTVAGALVAVGGGLGWSAWAESRAARCSGSRALLQSAWGDTRRAEVEAAIVGVGASFAPEVWRRTSASLDDYSARWVQQHTEACEATTVRGEQSTALMDLRMACLDRARMGLQAVTTELLRADAELVGRAHQIVEGLPALSRCDDSEALRSEVEPPIPEEREAVEAIEGKLATLRTQVAAGRYDSAKTVLEEVVGAAELLGYGPLRTEVALAEGHVLESLGEYEASEAALGRALELGARWRQPDAMAKAAISLIGIIARGRGDSERALMFRDVAAGLVHGRPEAEASLAHNVASALQTGGDLAGAEAELRRALELRTEILGGDHPLVADSLNNLANALADRGHLEQAEAMVQRAQEILTVALGPEHPELALAHHNLGLLYEERGDYVRAEAELRSALTLWERALGRQHPEVARALGSLGAVLTKQGRFHESEPALRRALEIRESTLGPEHPDVATSHSQLAELYVAQGHYQEALRELERALELQERRFGADHLEVAKTRGNVGTMLAFTGDLERAERSIRQSIDVLVTSLGSEHPDVGTMRASLGDIYAMRGDHAAAVVESRAALAILESALGPDNPALATALHNLGVALAEQGNFGEAEVAQRRALTLWEPALDPDHPLVASARHHLGHAMLEQGRASQALPLVEQAWIRRQQDDVPAHSRAETAFLLARALPRVEGERARALAEQAQALLVELGPSYEERAAEVERWLDAHR